MDHYIEDNMSNNRKWMYIGIVGLTLVILIVSLIRVNSNKVPATLTPTSEVLVTPIASPTPTLTPKPYPTVTIFPTASPEGWELTITPTQIRPVTVDDAIRIVVVEDATDGVRVRSGPGYECPENAPNCNWVNSIFPPNNPDNVYLLLEIDTSHDVIWCGYTANFSLGQGWSVCDYLKPAYAEDCEIVKNSTMYIALASCTGDESNE